MSTTYTATVTREDGWWMIHVPAIDGLTQARRLADARLMARELIAVTQDVPLDTVDATISIESIDGIAVREVVDSVTADRAEAARLEAEASARARDLARTLATHKVPLRDIGTVLGVSHQRAYQLVSA